MRLIDLDAIMAQFPKADFYGDAIENMKAYPYWKTDITGLINILEDVPIIEQSEDCISRAEAIKEFQIFREYSSNRSNSDWVDRIEAVLKDLPSVTPWPVWIPVSERLPKDYVHVLCQFTLGGMGECYLAHGVFHVVGGLVMTCNEVIAWMPRPQPYEEESEVQKNDE